MNDQGFGVFHFSGFIQSFRRLAHATIQHYFAVPEVFNFTDKDYFFPFSAQPMYYQMQYV